MGRAIIRLVQRNGIALLALFLALGGTTYAASTALIGSNSVASPQVVNGSLKTVDLSSKARKALKGNRGLRGLSGAQGTQGTQGTKGATGAKGATGVQGVAGATNVVVRTTSDTVAATSVKLLASPCNAGEKATGGGGNDVATPGVNIIQSAPQPFGAGATPTGWQVTYHNTTGSTASIFAYAICASP